MMMRDYDNWLTEVTSQLQSNVTTAVLCLLLPAGPRGRLVLRLLRVFRVCIYICASALITCAIIMSRTLLPCDLA